MSVIIIIIIITGTSVGRNMSYCSPCQPGSYSDKGQYCIPCASGYYTSLPSQSDCNPCFEGISFLHINVLI